MKVILLKGIKGLGKIGDVLEVKDGYGRNFLIPKRLAELATGAVLREVARKKISEEAKEKKLEEEAKEILGKMGKKPLEFEFKKTPKGKTFGSLGEKEIEEALERQYPEIKGLQLKVDLEEPIKEFGEFPLSFTLVKKIKGKIKVVVRESAGKPEEKK